MDTNHTHSASASEEARNAISLFNQVEEAVKTEVLTCQSEEIRDPYDCSWSKSYIEDKLESSIPSAEFLRPIQATKPAVIFFGESHVDHRVQDREPALIEMLARNNPDLNCLFIESKSSHQTHIDNYMSGRSSFEESVAPFQRSATINYLAAARQELLDTAKRNNIKVLAIDLTHDNLDTRNEFMATKISESISDGTCKNAVMIVGKEHVRETIVDSHPRRDTSIPTRIRNNNVTSFTVNLEQSESINRWDSYDCNNNFRIPNTEVGFRIDEDSPAKGNRPANTADVFRPTLWSDFDGTLIIP